MANKPAGPQEVFKLANEKCPEFLSAVKLFDVKQARAALASARHMSIGDQPCQDSELADFLTTLGANLFASANSRGLPKAATSLLSISDRRRNLVPIHNKIHHLKPQPNYITEIAVPSHIIPKYREESTRRVRKRFSIVQSSLLAQKQENAKKMRESSRIILQNRILSGVHRIGTLSIRILEEKEMYLQSIKVMRMTEERMSEVKSMVTVVVVGAGLAGLSAADQLLSFGFSNIVVLEASDRVGGRIHSVPYNDPPCEQLEIGVSSVDHANDKNYVYALMKLHGLVDNGLIEERPWSTVISTKYLPTSAETVFKTSLSSKLIASDSHLINSHIKSNYCTNVNLAYQDYIRERHRRLTHDNNHVVSKRLANIFELVQQLPESGKHQQGYVKHDLAVHLIGVNNDTVGANITLPKGMSSLLDPLAARLKPNKLKLNARVQKVEWQASLNDGHPNCRIICSNGRTFYAHHVIITIPLGYLKENADKMFEPALPTEKIKIFQKMGFGTICKVYLCYDVPFWSFPFSFIWPGISAEENKLWSHTIKFTCLKYHPKVVEVSLLGTIAETMPDLDVSQQLTAILYNYHRTDIPQPVLIYKSDWYSNPLFRGTHPYLNTQCSEKDPSLLAEPLMCGDLPVVMFAGDYTYSNYSCLTHAARASGLREAHRLQNCYNTLHGFENTYQ